MTERAVSGHPLAGPLGQNKRAAIIRLGPLFALGVALAIVAAGSGARLPTVGSPERGTQWTVHIQRMDEALARKNVSAAEMAWHDAYGDALASRRWEAMLDVGNAYLRIGAAAGSPAAAQPKARRAYLAAFIRARQQGSLDGVLQAAGVFAELGDREVVEQCLSVAETLAARGQDPHAQDRVRAFRERLYPRFDAGDSAGGMF